MKWIKKLFKQWKYDSDRHRRKDNKYQIREYYLDGECAWITSTKEEYIIDLAEHLIDREKERKEKLKKYDKAIKYLKKKGIIK